MMADLVSILIPAYNAERWVGNAIGSALEQTWSNKEVIVVDDGSTDNTLHVAKLFESKMVKVATQENIGAAGARNQALRLAQGTYIQWLDADDLLAPDKIAQQLNVSGSGQNSRLLLSSGFGKFYFRHWKADFAPTSLWCDLPPAEWLLRKFRENAWMNPAVFLVSRRLTELAGPWNTHLSLDDDGEYFARVIGWSDHVKFTSGAKSYYRIGDYGSLSKRVSEAACRSLLTSQMLSIDILLSLENSERTRRACIRYLQASFDMYYPEMSKLVAEATGLARRIGGDLVPPALSWKYSLLRRVFGWKVAKACQRWIPRIKASGVRALDSVLYSLEDAMRYKTWPGGAERRGKES
jgi:glycosyltransferase involved in cell wall biosynthesis